MPHEKDCGPHRAPFSFFPRHRSVTRGLLSGVKFRGKQYRSLEYQTGAIGRQLPAIKREKENWQKSIFAGITAEGKKMSVEESERIKYVIYISRRGIIYLSVRISKRSTSRKFCRNNFGIFPLTFPIGNHRDRSRMDKWRHLSARQRPRRTLRPFYTLSQRFKGY